MDEVGFMVTKITEKKALLNSRPLVVGGASDAGTASRDQTNEGKLITVSSVQNHPMS